MQGSPPHSSHKLLTTAGSAGNQRSWASLLFGLVNLSEQVRAYRRAELIRFVFVSFPVSSGRSIWNLLLKRAVLHSRE